MLALRIAVWAAPFLPLVDSLKISTPRPGARYTADSSIFVSGRTIRGLDSEWPLIAEVYDHENVMVTAGLAENRRKTGSFTMEIKPPAGGWPSDRMRIEVFDILTQQEWTSVVEVTGVRKQAK